LRAERRPIQPRCGLIQLTKARTRLGICSREALTAELQRIPTDPHCLRARKNHYGESTEVNGL
jgi:hypothetical protein